MKLLKQLFLFLSFCVPGTVFSQIGNTNGQYDTAIKQVYSILELLNKGDKKALKELFSETSFQSKKEFQKIISSSNLKWVKEILTKNGIPERNDLVVAGWKTVSKDQNASFSLNITLYFKGQNVKKSSTDDHFCFNFYKASSGEFLFNGLLFFKKSDYLNSKKMGNYSK